MFQAPDVRIQDLKAFEAPHVRLDDLTAFDTPAPRPKNRAWEWMESLASTIVFVLLFTGFVAQATKVPTESMMPTIMVGDHFFLDKVLFPGNFPEAVRPWLPRRSVERGDIIAFKSPIEVTPFVKRVIAVGGDTVEIRSKVLILNGEPKEEPYKIHTDTAIYNEVVLPGDSGRDNWGPQTVPEDHFFVMGDNRDRSNDSRFWGFVHRDAIIGKPLFVYWSYESDPFVSGYQSWADWGRENLSIAVHFFSRTRWFRTGTMVN